MRILFCCALLATIAACKSKNTPGTNMPVSIFVPDMKAPGPPAMVYKTRQNYDNLVPIILSEDKSRVLSYPHPSDLVSGDGYLVPTSLKNGYLLDNKGINKDVAFINMTYESYARLKEAPAVEELLAMVIDKDPLAELCNCGNRSALADAPVQLGTLIDSGRLRTSCLPIK